MNVLNQFSRENIINNLSSYEVYYQVALGSLINETKSNNIDSNIEFEVALGSILELLLDIKDLDNANDIYEKELEKQSSMDAVQYFVNQNLDLVKSGTFNVEPIINQINDEKFFNETMLKIYNNEKINNKNKWESIITEEIATSIYNQIKELTK